MALKKILAIISIFLLIVPLPACSSINKTLNWGDWWGGKKETGIDQKGVNNFFENIRPASGNAESHYLLACHYQERDKHREAVEEFRKAISINPIHLKAYNGLGVSFDHLKIHSLAIESYKRALTINPDLDYVQNNLGYSYLLAGNFDEAVTAFQRASALNPQDKRFHNNLALAYAEKGQFDLALSEFKNAGEEASAHYNMAQFYFKKGLYKEAKGHYAIALELNPSSQAFRSGFRAASALAAVFDSKPEKQKTSTAAIPAESSPQAKDRDQDLRTAEIPEITPGKEAALKSGSHPDQNNRKEPVIMPSLPSVKAEIAQTQLSPYLPESKSEETYKAKTPEAALKSESHPDRDNRRDLVIIPSSPSLKAEIAQPQFSPSPLESKAEEPQRAQIPEPVSSPPPSLQRIFSQSPSSSSFLTSTDREELKAETIKAPLKEVFPSSKEGAGSGRIDNPALPLPSAHKEISPLQPLLSHQETKAKNEDPSDNLKKGAGSHLGTSFKIAVGYELQIGTFRSLKQAKSQADILQSKGYPAALKPWKDKSGYEWHRIVLGPFATSQEALAKKGELAKSGKARDAFLQFTPIRIDLPKMAESGGKVSEEKGKLAKAVGIEISNGNGVYRMAQMLGNCLSEAGLNVCRLTNASSFNYATTTIYYQKGYDQAAKYLAGYFPGCDNLKELEKLDRENVKVKILIGKDLLGRNKLQELGKAS